jgi:hypothetical protein
MEKGQIFRFCKKFLIHAEKLGIRYSDYCIADSIAIQEYFLKTYGERSVYIPYGANLFYENDPDTLSEFGLKPYGYDMLIARLEPENSIEIILDGVNTCRFRPAVFCRRQTPDKIW